jgi:hypothetical protein
MNNAVIIQQSTSPTGYQKPWNGIFYDMLRLTNARHAAYARAHCFDYWSIMGDIHPEMKDGAWAKIWLIQTALQEGYEFVAWIDADAAIMDFNADLRDALPDGKFIGACNHDPDKSAYLKSLNVPPHMNVGVLYIRNSPLTKEFIADWLASWPGKERWAEQGSFNDLVISDKYREICIAVEDTYNATVNVNQVEKPIIQGWHGVMPPDKRFQMMRTFLSDDFMKFRV